MSGPAEIERAILQVEGVREAAVVGKPDRMRGEVPVAFVVMAGEHDTAAITSAIHRRCEAALADFKQPREIRFLDDMPRAGGIAKISKPDLRRRIEAEQED